MSALGATLVLVLAFTVAVVRLGRRLGFDTVFAEDGSVFLAQDHSDGAGSLTASYAGYAHLVPRLVVHLVDLLPLADAAAALAVSAALIQATAAWAGYVVVRAHCRSIGPALLVAAAVAMVPVGAEVVLSVANAQWFLLFGAVAVQFWSPFGVLARLVQIGFGVLLVLSCPFGFLVVAVVSARAAIRRTAWDVVGAASLVAAAVVQLWVMATSGMNRIRPSGEQASVLQGYLSRVLADGVLGTGRFQEHELSSTTSEAFVILVVFAAMVTLLVRRRGWGSVVPVAVFLSLSAVTYAAPVLIAALQTSNPGYGGRYYVAPALFWLLAVALTLPTTVPGEAATWATRLLAAVVTIVVAAGLASSYRVATRFRADPVSWSAEVDQAGDRCRLLEPGATVEVPIAPKGWAIRLPCRAVVDGT